MDYFIETEIQNRRRWLDGEADSGQWERTHSVEEYARLFDGANGAHATGHKDADLLFWRPSHPRIARYVPACRLVLMLRNPVQRAWSHYWNEIAKGREWLSFGAAVDAEEQRCNSSAYARLHLSYVRRGFYEESLEALFEHIPRERVLVTIQEDCRDNPQAVLRSIYGFVGVDAERGMARAGEVFNENTASIPRPWARSGAGKMLADGWERISDGVIRRVTTDRETRRRWRRSATAPFRQPSVRTQMDSSVRRKLLDLYAPHTEALERMLGRDLPRWKQ